MQDALDELLSKGTLLTIAAAIALGYAVLNVAQAVGTLALSAFTEQSDQFGSVGGPLSLEVAGRALEFGSLVGAAVTLAVVLAAILYVVKPDQRNPTDEVPVTGD